MTKSEPTPPETMREEIEALALNAYVEGYKDGYVDGRYPEGFDGDEREVHREIDSTAYMDGWGDSHALALLHSTPVAGGEGSDVASHPAPIEAPREVRTALESARDLLDCVRQDSGSNTWWISADDPETAVCDTLEKVTSALDLISGGSEATTASPERDPPSLHQELPQPGCGAAPSVRPAPSRLEVISALVGAFHKHGGMAAAETGMVNVEGYMADAVMALYGDVPSGSTNRAMIRARLQP